jgi:hypothetical protein
MVGRMLDAMGVELEPDAPLRTQDFMKAYRYYNS